MNHRIFERTLHSLVFRGVCLFECHVNLNTTFFVTKSVDIGLGDCWRKSASLECISWAFARVIGVIVSNIHRLHLLIESASNRLVMRQTLNFDLWPQIR